MATSINRVQTHYTKKLFTVWTVVAVILAVVIFLWRSKISAILTQGGSYGLYINLIILIITIVGMANLVHTTFRLQREEKAYDEFYREIALTNGFPQLTKGTLISDRLSAMDDMYKASGHVETDSLAAVVVAREYARSGLARFVQNILILLGVFGTILALSLALLGASDDLLNVDGAAVGSIIGNMSVAFSTTLTSIACYLIFAFVSSSVSDTQTMVVSSLEEITATDIAPYYVASEEKIGMDVERILAQTQSILEQANDQLAQSMERLAQVDALMAQLHGGALNVDNRMETMVELLREGFRLSDNER